MTMDEVGTALIAIALVLSAVFVPTAFIGGITGQFYRQFAITIATATVISAVQLADAQSRRCARTPVQAACTRRATRQLADRARCTRFFRGFNRGFDALAHGYGGSCAAGSSRQREFMLLVYAG